ncbi:MAG: universal stress protein [Sedimentibacter sp.]|uniref:universal stress protein n=1 Tax=Sedimentibacter sp. TaxID=1960295 RepID=UPI00315811F5
MKKILVPIDGSTASQKAAEKAVEFAKLFGSEVTFMHVIYVPDTVGHTKYGIYMEYDFKEMKQKMVETGTKFLDSFLENVDCSGVGIQKKIVVGQPYEEILGEAAEGAFDLIVMGRRGFSKVKRFFVGSVTQRVISDAPCPVFVVLEQ